jgi:hypothetical protein
MKTSPLVDSEDGIKTILENQADPMKVFKPIPYDEMKAALQEWLAPEGEEDDEDTIISEPAESFDNDVKEAPKSNYSLSAGTPKKSAAEKFDAMFEGEDDDLPF